MYRLITTDLDETLLNDEKKVCQRNRDAIAAARDKGVKVVLATGRPWQSARGTLEEIGEYQQPGEYMISFNGGAITENAGEKLLYFQGMDFAEIKELFERALKYDVGVHVYTIDKTYGWNLDEKEHRFLHNRLDVEELEEPNIDFLKDDKFVKILYYNTDRDYLNGIEEDLKDITGNMDVSYSSNRYLEFNRKGVNKGTGLARLAEILGIDIAETMALGDNFNDLAMIETAGLGVGVANTVPGVREKCDYITQADYREGGVAEAIEKFVLNED